MWQGAAGHGRPSARRGGSKQVAIDIRLAARAPGTVPPCTTLGLLDQQQALTERHVGLGSKPQTAAPATAALLAVLGCTRRVQPSHHLCPPLITCVEALVPNTAAHAAGAASKPGHRYSFGRGRSWSSAASPGLVSHSRGRL